MHSGVTSKYVMSAESYMTNRARGTNPAMRRDLRYTTGEPPSRMRDVVNVRDRVYDAVRRLQREGRLPKLKYNHW